MPVWTFPGRYTGSMLVRPCPICRKPVRWDTTPTRPFCSDRCRLKDLGAWSGEGYRVPGAPEQEEGEGWSGTPQDPEPG